MTTLTTREGGAVVATGTLRGCALSLVAAPVPDEETRYILSLDREPATYCRRPTRAEIEALARTNPDDGIQPGAYGLLNLLALVTAALHTDGYTTVCYAPIQGAELVELSRLAALVLAIEGVRA